MAKGLDFSLEIIDKATASVDRVAASLQHISQVMRSLNGATAVGPARSINRIGSEAIMASGSVRGLDAALDGISAPDISSAGVDSIEASIDDVTDASMRATSSVSALNSAVNAGAGNTSIAASMQSTSTAATSATSSVHGLDNAMSGLSGSEAVSISTGLDRVSSSADSATSDIEDATDAIEDAADATDELQDHMVEVEDAAGGAAGEMGGLGDAASSTSSGFGGLAAINPATMIAAIGAAATAAAAAVAALAAVIAVKFTAAIWESAKFSDRFSRALGAVAGDMQQGQAEFDNVIALTQELGLETQQTVQEYQRLRNVGFDPAEAENIVKLTADLKALGVRAESVGSIMNAIGKIRAQGKLQGDELMMLAEAGVGIGKIYDNMAESLGVSRDEIMRMQQAGELTDDIAMPAIEAAILDTVGGTEAGEVGKELANSTLGGFIDRSKAGFEAWKIGIAQEISPGLNQIAELAQGTIAKLTESGKIQKFTDFIVDAFNLVIDFIINNWPTIEAIVLTVIDAMIWGIDMLRGAWDWLMTNVDPAMWKALGVVLLTVVAVLATMGAILLGTVLIAIGMIAAPILLIIGLFAGLYYIIIKSIEIFKSMSTRFKDAAKELGGNIIRGIMDGIMSMFGPLMGIVGRVGGAIIGGLSNSVDAHSPSREAYKIGGYVGQGAAIGLEDNASWPVAAASGLGSSMTAAMESGAGGGMSMRMPSVGRGSASSQSINFGGMTLNVQAQPGATAQDGERLADGLAPRMREEFGAMLEDAILGLGV